MREINEYTAEVFRRSEKRIQERRRSRGRILSCCVPLLICLTVFSAALLPKGSMGSAENGNMEIKDGDGSIACSFMQARIQGAGALSEHYEELVTDKLKVDQMYFLIYDFFQIPTAENFPDGSVDYSTVETDAYIFTFITAEGTEASYSLSGNELAAKETGETVYLDAEQLAALREVFHLPN